MEHRFLGEICCPKQWKTISTSELTETGYPVYGANGIIGKYKEYNHEKATILVTCRGATCGSVVISKPYSYVNGNAMALDNLDDDICIDYLYFYLIGRGFADVISGSAQPQIIRSTIEKIRIPLCNFEKQKQIASVFSTINGMKLKFELLIEKYDQLVKARFIEMFGDPIVNEKEWRTKPLLDMGQCKNGMNFHYDDKGVEINCLGVGDFKNLSNIDNTETLPTVSLNEMPSEEYLLKDDDMVFVRSNGNKELVGRSLVVYPGNVPTTFSGFCIRYRKHDNEIMVPYLLRVLKTDSMRMKMAGRGANIQNLNQQILGTLVIPVPPLELQKQFTAFVQQVDKSKFRDFIPHN